MGTESSDLITLIPPATTDDMSSVKSFFPNIQSLVPTLPSSVHHPKASPSPKALSSPTHQTTACTLCFSPLNYHLGKHSLLYPKVSSLHPSTPRQQQLHRTAFLGNIHSNSRYSHGNSCIQLLGIHGTCSTLKIAIL